MSSWHAYPKIYNLGHGYLKDLLNGCVLVEEKIDGSQFSFGMHDGVLRTRSRGREFVPEAADNMFQLAIEQVMAVKDKLREGWTYRGEYLNKPKHNALAYDRVPAQNIMIFDIEVGDSTFLCRYEKEEEAKRLGFEFVPALYNGPGDALTPEKLTEMMSGQSVLGGQQPEGVVLKNYNQFGMDGKVVMGKHVSERFKEVHGREWKKENPSKGDVVQIMIEKYRSEARWHKAVQHLQERGELTGTPADIGPLMKEVSVDIKEECEDEIKAEMFKWVWKHIARTASRGLPEWYKDMLLQEQFADGAGVGNVLLKDV